MTEFGENSLTKFCTGCRFVNAMRRGLSMRGSEEPRFVPLSGLLVLHGGLFVWCTAAVKQKSERSLSSELVLKAMEHFTLG